jgi:hypothetical protein
MAKISVIFPYMLIVGMGLHHVPANARYRSGH